MGIFSFGRWPITAVITNVRTGGGTYTEFDKIRRIKKKSGEVEWRRRKNNEMIPPPMFEHMSGNNVVQLRRDSSGNYGRMEIDTKNGKIRGLNTDVANWAINAMERNRQQFERKKFWDKYGSFIATSAVLITIGIMIYLAMDQYLEWLKVLTGVADRALMACGI